MELTYWFCILSLIVGDALALKAIPKPGTKCTNQITFKVQVRLKKSMTFLINDSSKYQRKQNTGPIEVGARFQKSK